jgi:hypothetical protein
MTADTAGVYMLAFDEYFDIVLAVSDPTQRLNTLTFTLHRISLNAGTTPDISCREEGVDTIVTVTLPQGLSAGSTVTGKCLGPCRAGKC